MIGGRHHTVLVDLRFPKQQMIGSVSIDNMEVDGRSAWPYCHIDVDVAKY